HIYIPAIELTRRRELPETCIDNLKTSSSTILEEIAYKELMRLGREIGKDDIDKLPIGSDLRIELETEPYRRLSFESLISHLSLYLYSSIHAYRVLAIDHFERFSVQLRRDLADNFESFKTESKNKLF